MAHCAQGTVQSGDTYMGGDGMTEYKPKNIVKSKEYSEKQNAW